MRLSGYLSKNSLHDASANEMAAIDRPVIYLLTFIFVGFKVQVLLLV